MCKRFSSLFFLSAIFLVVYLFATTKIVFASTDNATINVTATVPGSSSATSATTTIGCGAACHPTNPTALSISNVRVVNIMGHTATVLWDTNVAANGTVEYGLTLAYEGGSVSHGSFATAHAIYLTDLQAGTTYQLRVRSADANGVQAVYTGLNFTTLTTDVVVSIPPNVQAFTATPGNQKNVLSWIVPDGEITSVTIIARMDRFPQSIHDGRVVYVGLGDRVDDVGLQNDVNVFYLAVVTDGSGQYSSGALAQAAPSSVLVLPDNPESPTSTTGTVTDPRLGPCAPRLVNGQIVYPCEIVVTTPTTTGATTTSVVATSTQSETPTSTITDLITNDGKTTSTDADLTRDPGVLPNTVLTDVIASGATAQAVVDQDVRAQCAVQHNQFVIDTTLNGCAVLTNEPMWLRVHLDRDELIDQVQEATGQVDGQTYFLTYVTSSRMWLAAFIAPLRVGRFEATVRFRLSDGSERRLIVPIRVESYGRILERDVLGRDQRIDGVSLRLSTWRDGAWVELPARFEVERIGFHLPNGRYRLEALKEGYDTVLIYTNVLDQLFHPTVVIRKSFFAVVQKVIAPLETAEVKVVTEQVAAPTIAIIAAANVATAASALGLINYARYLLTQPLLFLRRRKRGHWGIVYNAITKTPIDLATVRAFDAKTGRLVQTRVTDSHGRYGLLLPIGQYRLTVGKDGFIFPSQVMEGQSVDIDLLDLYHGEVIDVREGSALSLNVPLDPSLKMEAPIWVIWKHRLRHLQSVVSIASVILSIGVVIIAPSVFSVGLLVGQVLMYALFRRLAAPSAPKNWGYVYDLDTKSKLERVIVRIFDKKYHKLLETQVTDRVGRYGFFAKKNVYYLTAERPGYQRFVSSEIDLSKAEDTVIKQDVGLRRESQ